MPESKYYSRVLAEANRLQSEGVSFHDALPTLRLLSPSVIDSIKAGRDAYGLSLSDSKFLVHSSDTWADCRETFDQLHDGAEAIADEF